MEVLITGSQAEPSIARQNNILEVHTVIKSYGVLPQAELQEWRARIMASGVSLPDIRDLYLTQWRSTQQVDGYPVHGYSLLMRNGSLGAKLCADFIVLQVPTTRRKLYNHTKKEIERKELVAKRSCEVQQAASAKLDNETTQNVLLGIGVTAAALLLAAVALSFA